jgi:superoxide dismutase, Fe-Mn family
VSEKAPLRHQILPIPRKPYALNWLPERLIVSHYEKDYGAAVRSLNALRDRLAAVDPASVSPAELRALKREELASLGSVIFHELYFLNLGGDAKIPDMVKTALEKSFGGVHQWRRDFVASAQALAGGPGWVVLSYSPYDGRLYNQIAIDHSQAMVGAAPILVLDMYEHAYHLEFGANAAAYVDVFIRVIDWTAVAERLMRAAGDRERNEAGTAQEALPSISVEELHTVMHSEQQFQVVDARPRNYVSRDPDTMPNAVWRDPERVDDWCAQLSPEAPVFVYCAYGFEVGRSVTTARRERGFDARYIRGGLAAWYGVGGARAVRGPPSA